MFELLIIAAVLGYFWWTLTRKPDNFPPGPYRWPLIGNILEFKKKGVTTTMTVSDLRRRYGNVVGVYFSSNPVIIVSGLSEVREMQTRPECQGRPPGAVRVFTDDVKGIIFTQGEVWQEQRRFALRHLRDLGVGKRALETLIHEELLDMLNDVTKMAGHNYTQPVPVYDVINSIGANVIYHLMAGKRFQRGDPELQRLIDIVKRVTTVNNSSGGVANSFPFLLKYARWLTEYDEIMETKYALKDFLKTTIAEHEKNYNPDDLSDIVDFYMMEMKKHAPGASFNMEQLMTVALDLFVAGSDTTVNLLSYALLVMIREPSIQAKVHAELDNVVGRERLPSVDDKQRMPYIGATILEALRMANVVVLSVARATTSEFVFRGYVIPKDARVIVNLYEVHADKTIWGDPETFRPERFIDANGQLINHEALMAFGMGKRVCMGESMARTNIFLTFATLLQKFTLSVPEGEPTPSLEQTGGVVLSVKPFNMKVTPRY